MSLQYLLDGYNIIHKMPSAVERKLEEQRQYLVRFVENCQPQGSLRNPVTIVFDGQPDMGNFSLTGQLKTIFSQGKTADDLIKKIVEESSNPKQIVVVTDDKDIQFAVRASGAKVQPVAQFLAGAEKEVKKGKMKFKEQLSRPSKRVPKSVESEITAELENIWLKPKIKQIRKAK